MHLLSPSTCFISFLPPLFVPDSFFLILLHFSFTRLTPDPYQIYATSEERKQRNRQAQAAFRERRTEYIRQLESTIKRNEESLQTLQQNHRTAADECLMLRYKNSLLERILLEKGRCPYLCIQSPDKVILVSAMLTPHRH